MRHHVIGVAATFVGVFAAQALCSSAAGAQAADRRPDFVGVWRMDTTKFQKRDAELSALTLNVARHGDTLLIVTDVQDANRPPMQMHARYVPERLLVPAEPADTSLRVSPLAWEGDTLVLHTVEQRPQRTLKIEERWALDASGHTLSRQQVVVDGQRVSRQTLVFTRQ